MPERRGKGPRPWRVKYKLPDGTETSEAGFETKAAALTWGRDQEAKIREGRWQDPNAGSITVSERIDRWLAIQDVGNSTEYTREYLIRRFLRPTFGATALNAMTTEDITKWENGLPAQTGISRRTAGDARGLLCTILGDAAGTKPPLIPYNPATHYRRSNYARRVIRPACDGRYPANHRYPPRAVTVDATTWPGIPLAAWPTTTPGPGPAHISHEEGQRAQFAPPRGRGIRQYPRAHHSHHGCRSRPD